MNRPALTPPSSIAATNNSDVMETPTSSETHITAQQPAEAYLVKWGDHSNGMFRVIKNLPVGFLSDVTLQVENEDIPCHRLVLAAGSLTFYNYFLGLQNRETEIHSPGPLVIPIPNYSSRVVKAALQIMYEGEAVVRYEDLLQFQLFAHEILLKGCVPDMDNQQCEETTSAAGPSATAIAIGLMSSLQNCLPSPNLSEKSGKCEAENNTQDSGIDIEDEASGPVDLTLMNKQEMGDGSEDEIDGPVGVNRNVANLHDDPDDSEASRTVSALSEKSVSDENILLSAVQTFSSTERQKDPFLFEKLARLNTTVSVAPPNSDPNRGARKYKNYNQEDMKKAVDDVISHKCSALQASKKYNVPNRTLYDQVKRLANAKKSPEKVRANVSVDDILYKVSKATGSRIKK